MNMNAINNLFSKLTFCYNNCYGSDLFGKICAVDEILSIILKKTNREAINFTQEEFEDLWDIFCTVKNTLKAIDLIDGSNTFLHDAYCALCSSLGEYLDENFFADDNYKEIFDAFLKAMENYLAGAD